MNEEVVLQMALPYVKNQRITYEIFDDLYSMLSRKEQYEVSDILFRNNINLVDTEEIDNSELDVNEIDEDLENDFNILYDESLFMDNSSLLSEDNVFFEIHSEIKQSNENLCCLIQEGNKQAAQDLCIKNKRLVDKYVCLYQKRYGNRLDFEDLEQVGYMGLLTAAKKYDRGREILFSTYAVWWIRQAISREIMDCGYVIRIPVHMMERIAKVSRLNAIYMSEALPLLSRIKKIAEELGMSQEQVEECLNYQNNYLRYASLNSLIGSENDTELWEIIPTNEEYLLEDEIMNNILKEDVDKLLCELSDREKSVIKMRFGLGDGRCQTLEEIGEQYQITRERIRQIEAKALRRLRNLSRADKLRDYLY